MLFVRILRIDDVTALLYLRKQPADFIRRCLPVIIQTHHHIAAGLTKSCHQCGMLSEISGQIDAADISPLCTQPTDHLECIIRRAVVDQHDLIRIGRQLFHGFINLRHYLTDRLCGTIAGYHKTDKFTHMLFFLPSSVSCRQSAASSSIKHTSRSPCRVITRSRLSVRRKPTCS